MNNQTFPLQGIIGIVGNHADEIDLALDNELSCVEVRSDLLIDAGYSQAEVLEIVARIRAVGLNCLLTHRRHDHGGKFSGTEIDRVAFCLRAVEAGAQVVDVEWDSDSAKQLIANGVTTILSYHDFEGSPTPPELERLTDEMLSLQPAALKVVPTANSLGDSVQMLRWVAAAGDGPRRIGFAMGAAGGCSRILTTGFGAPITYASFGKPHAPGQISIDDLKNVYRTAQITRGTRLIGLLGDEMRNQVWANRIGQSDYGRQQDLIGIPLIVEWRQELIDAADFMGLQMVIANNAMASEVLTISPENLLATSEFQIWRIGADGQPDFSDNCTAEYAERLGL